MPLGTVAYAVVVIALSYFVLSRQIKKRRDPPLPPGPPRWPLVGSLFSMPKDNETREVFTSWGRQYGEITYARVLNQNIIVLNSKEAAVELLERRSAMYCDRPRLVMANELVGWGDNTLATMSYGEKFKQLRKLMHEGMNPKAIEILTPLQEQSAVGFLQKVLNAPSELHEHIRGTGSTTILKFTYGYNVQGHDDYFLTLAESAVNMFAVVTTPGRFLVDSFPWLKYVPWAPFKSKAKVWRKLMMEFCDRPMQYTREQMAKGQSQPCLIAAWIERADEMLDKAEADKNERFIKWAGASIYGAGVDTSTSSILTFFLAILHYPEAQAAAQAEIDRVVGSDRLPTYHDRASLPYVEALYKEVLRWQPVAPFAIPHRLNSKKDDEYRGEP